LTVVIFYGGAKFRDTQSDFQALSRKEDQQMNRNHAAIALAGG
jgi:hypothetical protein